MFIVELTDLDARLLVWAAGHAGKIGGVVGLLIGYIMEHVVGGACLQPLLATLFAEGVWGLSG